MAKTTKLVGYGISFDMKLVGGAKTADDFTRVAKSVQKSLNSASNATKSFEIAQEQLNQALRKGAISQKEYEDQLTRLRFREMKRVEQLERQRRAVLGLDKQESILEKNRRNRARMAGMAASGASGLGLGGRAAGAARFLGGAAGLGMGAMGLGVGFATVSAVTESIAAFAKLEEQLTGMKSLFGEELGEKLAKQFRSLAGSTILTNSQLIENAKIWASYGLTTDGLTDRLRRLGTVAGGNSEKFRALTIAFAQVNAQGRLMGQEKNQLINAGFSLQAVADAAGISMEDFADAMANGEITADHLNEALIRVTSEGGLFAGYLEAQADTISGKLTILSNAWEEFLQALGESEQGPAGAFLDKLIEATKSAKEAAEYWGRGEIPRAGTEESAATATAGGGGMLGATGAFADTSNPYAVVARTIQGMMDPFGIIGPEIEHIYGPVQGDISAYGSPELEAASRESERQRMEQEQQRHEEQLAADRGLINDFFERELAESDTTDQELSDLYASYMDLMQTPEVRREFEQQYGHFAPDQMGEEVNLMEQMAAEEDARMREEEERNAARLDDEIEFQRLRQDLLREEHREQQDAFREREREASEQLQKEKQMAQVPSVTGFEGGSVAEFQFLRRQTQESETALAVDKAEKKAAAQREQIRAERAAAEQEFLLEMRRISGSIETMNRQLQDTR